MQKKDLELEEKIKGFIERSGKYCRCEDILLWLGVPKSRVYLSYRGIDVTALNKEIGFVRRLPPKIQKYTVSKEDLIDRIQKVILERGSYTTRNDLQRGGYKIHTNWVTHYGIDIHSINASLGFHKDSAMSRFPDKGKLHLDIETYIKDASRYVSQQEIVDIFKVSLGYITKNVDTCAINFKYGYYQDYGYFEYITLKVLNTYFENVTTQKTFEGCRSNKGCVLRFDFFIEPNLLIESDGAQHWDPTHRFYSKESIDRDMVKSVYARSNDLFLIRIPFKGRWDTTFKNIENTLLENLKSLITTKQLETTNLKVLEALGLGNQQPSSFAETHGEGSTTIPKGSRVQENSKHVATTKVVEDIVCSQGKL